MAKMQRTKGSRVERLLVEMHHEAGIPCEKVSRSGYTGEDLRIGDEFTGEVKARKEPMKTALAWLAGRDLLFVKPDRQPPVVVMTWEMYAKLMRR